VTDQISVALDVCSDLEVLLAQKYDPSAHLDRANNIFPAEYACCLLARVGCAARGSGAAERIARGKGRGAKGSFVPTFRPKVFDLWRNRARVEGALNSLREDAVASHVSRSRAGDASANDGFSLLYSTSELRMTLEPYMQLLGDADRQNAPSAMRAPSRFSAAIDRRLAALRQLTTVGSEFADYTIPTLSLEAEAELGMRVETQTGSQSKGQTLIAVAQSEASLSEVWVEDIESFD